VCRWLVCALPKPLFNCFFFLCCVASEENLLDDRDGMVKLSFPFPAWGLRSSRPASAIILMQTSSFYTHGPHISLVKGTTIISHDISSKQFLECSPRYVWQMWMMHDD